MWTRRSVKEKGKKALFFNYWKCVLVALIFSVVVGAVGGASSGTSGFNLPQITEQYTSDEGDSGTTIDVNGEDIEISKSDMINILIAVVVVFLIVMAICTAIGLVLQYLLLKPIEYGCRKFFRKNLEEPAKVKNVFYAFDSNYRNIVKAAFMRDLKIFLWSLLFIVPGIIKYFEYYMVPYIISENPSMNYKEALAESKALMKGNKWRTFVLQLSFAGWVILSGLTCGVLGIFFVHPYLNSTNAALYESIKYGIDVA